MPTTPSEMAEVFELVRYAVLQEATRPSPYDARSHELNRARFAKKLRELCHRARLRSDLGIDELWRHVWTKIRYAGFRAEYVTREIELLNPFLSDFRTLIEPDWHFDLAGVAHGDAVRDFLGKNGRFAGISYSRLAPKLCKILLAARAFREFPHNANPMAALFGIQYAETSDEAFWVSHQRLARLVGYTTALHVMMDVGFPCVKPDIWLVRLMCLLGWIEDVLPAGTPDSVIRKKYQSPNVTKAVIECARRISVTADIPLREIDFVLVKYGQAPGEFGVVRSLHKDWRPIQEIMSWKPDGLNPSSCHRL